MYDGIVQELIDELGRLPGVGPKSAQRIAFECGLNRATAYNLLRTLVYERYLRRDEGKGDEPWRKDRD